MSAWLTFEGADTSNIAAVAKLRRWRQIQRLSDDREQIIDVEWNGQQEDLGNTCPVSCAKVNGCKRSRLTVMHECCQGQVTELETTSRLDSFPNLQLVVYGRAHLESRHSAVQDQRAYKGRLPR